MWNRSGDELPDAGGHFPFGSRASRWRRVTDRYMRTTSHRPSRCFACRKAEIPPIASLHIEKTCRRRSCVSAVAGFNGETTLSGSLDQKLRIVCHPRSSCLGVRQTGYLGRATRAFTHLLSQGPERAACPTHTARRPNATSPSARLVNLLLKFKDAIKIIHISFHSCPQRFPQLSPQPR
jgi:hypothetical protein